ncbi:pyroglutamyl-peptidase 1-like [Watersipora subatra]|uniref:pyroglutamyl-peptidase 1-like n=1 Tax=Watersipora subatra TaxID=2589382 RepID=UPI00355ADDC5
MSGSSSSEEDCDERCYPQLNPDLSMPGVKKEKITVVVTGFGPFGEHKINASWEAVKELSKLGVAHNVNLVTQQIPVEYESVQKIIPELWKQWQPKLVVHVGVSSIASELTFERQAHNNNYKMPDVAGKSAPSQCYNIDEGDRCLETGLDISKLCDDVNQSGCLAMATSSEDAGRYLCDFTYYASLCQDQSRTCFIHVPVLDQPYTSSELGHALQCSVQCMLKQLDLYHPLSLPSEEVMEQTRQQHIMASKN